MDGILESVQLNGTLAQTETLTGKVADKKETHPVVDSNGNHIIDSSGDILMDYRTGEPLRGDISETSSLSAELSSGEEIRIALAASEGINGEITIPSSIGGVPYTGDYEVTPAAVTQILYTQGKSMRENVTINPIPSNYGLITWNGTTLTVS